MARSCCFHSTQITGRFLDAGFVARRNHRMIWKGSLQSIFTRAQVSIDWRLFWMKQNWYLNIGGGSGRGEWWSNRSITGIFHCPGKITAGQLRTRVSHFKVKRIECRGTLYIYLYIYLSIYLSLYLPPLPPPSISPLSSLSCFSPPISSWSRSKLFWEGLSRFKWIWPLKWRACGAHISLKFKWTCTRIHDPLPLLFIHSASGADQYWQA